MKKFILIAFFIFLFGFTAYSQVTVSQQFLDDANKAFALVIEQRDALAKFTAERKATDAERAAADALIKGMNELLAVKDRTISQYELLSQFQQKVIQFQFEVIEKLEKQLKKPKSLFDKILRTLERVALIVGGIAIGRGLSF